MDWDDLKVVLAVARGGSHSKAARTLGVAQPTVGRRLQALERALGGTHLFERSGNSLVATRPGREMVMRAEQIEALVASAERLARDDVPSLTGHVRVTASDWLVSRVLPRAIVLVEKRAPELRVDLSAEPRLVSLPREDADLALRPRRFETNSVWQRAVGFVEFAVYATPSYLSQRGHPLPSKQCAGHDLIVMDEQSGAVADGDWLRRIAARARVRARANGRDAMAGAAALSLGLACLPTLVGDATPSLTRVPTLVDAPGRTLWLGAHRDRRDVVRVRWVADAIRTVVARVLPRRP